MADHAVAKAQQAQDRFDYVAITRQVRTELGEIAAPQIDIEICLRAQSRAAEFERLTSQSDQAISLDNPTQIQGYVERINSAASV
jgi:ferritin